MVTFLPEDAGSWRSLLLSLTEASRYQEAIIAARNIVRLTPGDLDARRTLGQILSLHGLDMERVAHHRGSRQDLDEAGRLLRKSLDARPDSETRVALAHLLLEDRRHPNYLRNVLEARKLAEAALLTAPCASEPLRLIAEAHEALGADEQALLSFERMVQCGGPDVAYGWGKRAILLAKRLGATPGAVHFAMHRAVSAAHTSAQHCARIVRLFATEGWLADALSLARAGITFEDADADLWLAYAQVHQRASKANVAGASESEAERGFRAAALLAPKSGLVLRCLGRFLASDPRRSDEAETVLRRAIRVAPLDALAHAALAEVLQRADGRNSEAEMHFLRAILLAPGCRRSTTQLGQLLEDDGQTERANRLYQQAFRATSASWPLVCLARLNSNHRANSARAHSHYLHALELNPDDPLLHVEYASFLYQHIHHSEEEVEQHCRRSLELDPSLVIAHVLLAQLLSAVPERVCEAEASLREAVAIDPEHASGWRLLGVLLSESGDQTQAETCLRRAVQLGDVSARVDLAHLLEERGGSLRETIWLYEQVLADNPADTDVAIHLAMLLMEYRDEPTYALGLLHEAAEDAPHDPLLWVAIARARFDGLGDVEGAETALNYASRLGYLEADVQMAWLDILADRTAVAEARLTSVVEKNPEHAEAWTFLAIVRRCQHAPMSTITDALEQALTLAPNNPTARAQWALVLRDLGDPDQALLEAERAVDACRGGAIELKRLAQSLSVSGEDSCATLVDQVSRRTASS